MHLIVNSVNERQCYGTWHDDVDWHRKTLHEVLWLFGIPLYSLIASVSIFGYTGQEMIKVTCKALTVWDVGRTPPPAPAWHTWGALMLVAWAQDCDEEESLCETEPLSWQQTLCLPLSSLSVLWFSPQQQWSLCLPSIPGCCQPRTSPAPGSSAG